MNTARRGKIAQLSPLVREKLNRRLRNGVQCRKLVEWLNSLPSVCDMVATDFGGSPITAQNLSEWRKGGFREWLVQRDAIEALARVKCDVIEMGPLAGELTDAAALWLTARYLVTAQGLLDKDGALDWKMLREFCSDLVALRRGDHSAARLGIEERHQQVEEETARGWYKRREIQGLEALLAVVKKTPKAIDAYLELSKYILKPSESQVPPVPDPRAKRRAKFRPEKVTA